MEDEPRYCRNCRAEVQAEYCPQCGQREGRADKRFLDLAGEMLGDVLDMDSRFWRTFVYLLFRPGFLSAEFIAGRRARYLPPLRLYLVISFIVFLLMSFGAAQVLDPDEGGVKLEGDSVVVAVNGDDVAEALGEADDPNDFSIDLGISDEDSPQWLRDAEHRMEGNAGKLRDDPNRFIETMLDYLPQMMFLLLPVFALIIQLLYLGAGFHYLQHLVFSLHYHCFVYMLYLVAHLLDWVTLNMDGWLILGLLVYLPLALRTAYGSSWAGAISRSLFVYFSYALVLIAGFVSVAALALFLI